MSTENPTITFEASFGDFKVKQYAHGTYGSMHRLTPEQFDALYDAFTGDELPRTLTTDGRYGPPTAFRTVDIDFGGLKLSIFANVPCTCAYNAETGANGACVDCESRA